MKDYIVSARKYRPMTFDAVVGQSALITTLKNAVKSGKLAHAYLFCGPRGVGKTTCARIFAKAINCMNPTPDGEACNECESCRSFNEQRSFNIFELDAASNNSVENIKSLMDQTRIPPQVGKYKVFIIDEVHMLSTSAFNAFLKTLEEPPAHVVFILATTEKHKILPTIISRCQIYDFERMTTMEIVNHLKNVAQQEGVAYEEAALHVIAEKADGGMRDALSVFDQAASFCQGNITYDKVLEDLNVLDIDNYFKVIDLSLQNQVSDIMLLLNDIIARGFDEGHLVNGLASHIRNVMMAKDSKTTPLLDASEKNRQKYQEQAQKCPIKFLYHALQLLNQCDVNYRQSSNKRLLVELTLIQIAQITQPDDASDGVRRSPKSLKSLFIHLATRPLSQPKQYVGRLETDKVSSENAPYRISRTDNSNDNIEKRSMSTVAKRPKLTMSDIGITFNDLRGNPKKKPQSQNDALEVTTQEKPFTDDELRLVWQNMCHHMPQDMVGLGTRMRNVSPFIKDFPQIEAVIENDILLKQIQDIKDNVITYLRENLRNNQIDFSLRLAEAQEVTKIYSKKELYELMKKSNPQLSKLCDTLKLDLI